MCTPEYKYTCILYRQILSVAPAGTVYSLARKPKAFLYIHGAGCICHLMLRLSYDTLMKVVMIRNLFSYEVPYWHSRLAIVIHKMRLCKFGTLALASNNKYTVLYMKCVDFYLLMSV